MALYWPDEKVALVIVDDPLAQPFDKSLGSDWSVLETTIGEITNLEGSRRVCDTLCAMLGQEAPRKTPEWLEANKRLHNALMKML